MTKLSDLGPPFGRMATTVEDESEYFYQCPTCGQTVDRRDLRQVFYHDEDGHEPLEMEDNVVCLEVEKRKRPAPE
ncbi:hypothetical protein [Pseudaminobacter sp. NGMCC 1.201702]|uniref:hypothetical protein n=1 Tax=Pseudaminobacter sp. NGMCC 1.201702 TaxID=3391825 RepID=UPI0039EF6027